MTDSQGTNSSSVPSPDRLTREAWGTAPGGQPVFLFTLRGAHGTVARLTNFGGVIVSVHALDRHGTSGDIVLGHEELGKYTDRDQSPYFGATVGRFANRIKRGQFSLDGTVYQLAVNNPPNALHGGPRGFDHVVWDAEERVTPAGPEVRLRYHSPDGEEHYPGNLDVTVTFTLADEGGADALHIDYQANADRATILNLTNHTYFNLSGEARRDILGHELTLHADHITPIGADLIPTGAYLPVEGTPFDFRPLSGNSPHQVGERVNEEHEQLRFAGGYDHNFVLRGEGGTLRPAATLYDPQTGRVLETFTTEPGVQVYSGNFLNGSIVGKGGQVYGHRWGLCLETQHFPNSPNIPYFPSVVLRPGEVFSSHTVYVFSAR